MGMVPMAIVAIAPDAFAHEGHGDPAWYGSVLHYLTEPEHLPLTLAVLAAAILASRWVPDHLRARKAPRAAATLGRREVEEG
jgi:hydrogenase/urease accessory protein HupE